VEIGQDDPDVAIEHVLAEQPAPEEERATGLDLLGELIGRDVAVAGERDRLDGDPGPLVDDEANDPHVSVALLARLDRGPVVPALAVRGFELTRARLLLEPIRHPAREEGELRAQGGRRKRAATVELDPEAGAGGDLEVEVHPVRARTPVGRSGSHLRLVEALRAQPLLGGARVLAQQGFLVGPAFAKRERLRELIGRQTRVALEAHDADARPIARVERHRHVALAAVRHGVRSDVDAGAEVPLASIAREEIALRLGQARGRGIGA